MSTSPASSIAAQRDGSASTSSIRSERSSPAVSGQAFRKETAAARSLAMALQLPLTPALSLEGEGGVHLDHLVKAVPLGRDAPRRADEVVERLLAQRLRHGGAGHVVDALLEHGAV